MLIAEYRKKLIEEMKDTQGLEVMDRIANSKCISHPSEINTTLAAFNEPTLTDHELEYLYRAWPFEVKLEDGTYRFLMWDLGNSHMDFYSDFTYEAIIAEINKVKQAEGASV